MPVIHDTETETCTTARSRHDGTGNYCNTAEGRWASVVREYIENLRYGEVTLTIHEGRVVQIERSEKMRF